MKWLWRSAAVLALLVLALITAVWWLVGTPSGLRWATHYAQQATHDALQLDNVQGALGDMRYDRIAYALDGTVIELFGVEVRTALSAVRSRTLAIERLHIDRVRVRLDGAPSTTEKSRPTLPQSLALPIDVRLDAATVGSIEIVRADSTIHVRNLYVSYAGGRDQHQLASLRADTDFGLIGAAGRIATTRPFKMDAGFALLRVGEPQPDPAKIGVATLPASVRSHLGGTLREPVAAIHATLARAQADVRTRLAPFDRDGPEAIQSLEATATAIDLAAFVPTLPRTAITVRTEAYGEDGRLAGTLDVRNTEAGPLDHQRVPVGSVNTRFATDFTTTTFEQLAIALAPHGTFAGRGNVRLEPLTANVELNADRIDLRAFRSDLRQTALAGPIRITTNGPAQQTVSVTLTERDMRLGAQAQRDGEVIDITDLQLAARGGTVTGKGRVVLATPTQVDAAVAFKRFDPARFGAFPAGSINGNAAVKGSLGEPRRVDASWSIDRSLLRGQSLASRGRARVVGERVAQVDGSARLGANEATVRGAYGAANDSLQFRVAAPMLAQLADGFGGRLEASGTVTGTAANLQATVTARARELRLPADISVQALDLDARAGMQSSAPLAIKLVAQKAVTPQATLDRVALDTTGSRDRHDAALRVVAQQRSLDLKVRGGWSGLWPGKWAGDVVALDARGALPGGEATVRLAAPAPVAVATDNVSVRAFTLVVNGANLPEAQFRLVDLAWQPDRFSTQGAFERLSTRWLAAFVELPPGLETTVAFGGAWSIRGQPRLTGTLSIKREGGDLRLAGPPAIEAGLTQAAVDARFDDGRVNAQLDVVAKLATLQARATIDPVAGAPGLGITPESRLAFDAKFDVAEVRLISEPLLTAARFSGRVNANAKGSGTLGAPRFDGTLAADALGVDVPPYGVQLTDGKLRAQLQGETVNVTELSLRGGEGRFTGSGTMPLRPAAGSSKLAWRAENFRLLNRPDMRLVLTGNGEAGFAEKRFAARGELRADSGHFEFARQALPKPGDDVAIGGKETPAERGNARAPLDLDLQADLGKQLSIRGFGLDGKATGRVHLTTTRAGELRAEGRVQTVDAKFRAYGQQLVVDPGVLVFDGPIDNPTLEITAWRRNQQVEAGVQLSGTTKAPLVKLVSEPQVPEADRLSWLVLGRPPGNAEGGDLSLLQTAAGAMLSGRPDSSVPLTQKVANSIGLDELAVRSSSEIASNVVAVGKRLSDKLLITYEHGVGAAAESLVKLDYALSRRVSLRAATGTTTGVGVFYRRAWD